MVLRAVLRRAVVLRVADLRAAVLRAATVLRELRLRAGDLLGDFLDFVFIMHSIASGPARNRAFRHIAYGQ